jgi:hypothetical protein
MKPLLLIPIGLLLLSPPCKAQDSGSITTDRPAIGADPDLVPPHSLESENGFGWSNDGHHSTADLPESLVRYGLTDRIEIRTTVPNVHLTSGQPTETEDIQFGAKIRLSSNESAWPVSLVTALSAPTGTTSLSSGGWDPYATFSISHPLPRSFFAFSSATFAAASQTFGGRRLFTQEAVDLGYSLTPHHALYVECAPLYDGRQHYAGYTVDGGTIWTVRRNYQLDMRLGETVLGDASTFNISVGYSFRRFLAPEPVITR